MTVYEDVTFLELKCLMIKTPWILKYYQYIVFLLLISNWFLFALEDMKILCLSQHLSVPNLITS
jgi:hypothetical protein